MKLIVPENIDGVRLDKFLVHCNFSRKNAQEQINNGLVTVYGKKSVKCSTLVTFGDVIECAEHEQLQTSIKPEVEIPIVYEDDYLLIVNKPINVLAHPANQQDTRYSVTDFIIKKYGHIAVGEHSDRPGIVHRLDYKTSGLMIVAKKQETYLALKSMMAQRVIIKKYLAFVYGRMNPPTGTIKHYLLHSRNNYKKMTIAKYPKSQCVINSTRKDKSKPATLKEAITLYSTIETYEHFSILDCNLYTGRTHQIRLHLGHAGCGIVGDKLYGKNRAIRKLLSEKHLQDIEEFDRNALHAYRLQFTHPDTQQVIDVSSQMPSDISELIKKLQNK